MATRERRVLRITHRATGTVLAEGPLGWGITPFEGNCYIRRRYLVDGRFRTSWVPGLCVYEFLYVWMNWVLPSGATERGLAWLYWLPNPLLPFLWFRIAVPAEHPALLVTFEPAQAQSSEARGGS